MKREARSGAGGMAEEQKGWRWRLQNVRPRQRDRERIRDRDREREDQRQRQGKRCAEMHTERYEARTHTSSWRLGEAETEIQTHGETGTERHFRIEAEHPERGPPGRRREGDRKKDLETETKY